MRMDPDQELTAHEIVNDLGRAPAGAAAARVRRGALRRPDRPRDRARAAPRELTSTQRARRRDQVGRSGPGPVRRRPSRPADVPGAADRRQRRAAQLEAALPVGLGSAAARAAGWPRSPSTRWRTGASSASWPRGRAAACARPSCRSASAGASRRPSSSPVAPSLRPRARSPPTPDPNRRTCAPPASWRSGQRMTPPADARRRGTRAPADRRPRRAAAGAPGPPAAPRRPSRPGRRRRGAAAASRRARGAGPRSRRRAAAAAPLPADARRQSRSARRRPRASRSPLLDRIVRGRAWIPLLGVMLAGIVAMQVEVSKLGPRSAARSSRARPCRPERAAAGERGPAADDQRIERLAATAWGW